MDVLEFNLPIEPMAIQSQNRIGYSKRLGRAFMFSSKKKTDYVGLISALAKKYAPNVPWDGPVNLYMVFTVSKPQKPMHKLFPIAKPDLDNLEKGTIDGLTKAGFWTNDSRICEKTTEKIYGKPSIYVKITYFE